MTTKTFLQLPPELRDEIYSQLFKKFVPLRRARYLSCRQIKAEMDKHYDHCLDRHVKALEHSASTSLLNKISLPPFSPVTFSAIALPYIKQKRGLRISISIDFSKPNVAP